MSTGVAIIRSVPLVLKRTAAEWIPFDSVVSPWRRWQSSERAERVGTRVERAFALISAMERRAP